MNLSFNFLSQRREIITSTLNEITKSLQFQSLDSRTKRNSPFLEYFLQSVTYYFSYEEILKFNAGIYNADFRTEEFFDKDDNLLGSGYYYSVEPTGIELILKTKELFESENESTPVQVPLLCLKASEIVEDYAPENFQEMIDNTIGSFPDYETTEELESRKRFNYLVSQNIQRALIRYGESREQTTRELIHNNFRKRVEAVLKSLPGIVIAEDNKFYSLNKKSKKFLSDASNLLTPQEKNILVQNLQNEMKKFDSYKKGISRNELIESQIKSEQGLEVNAPQIYRSNDLKEVLAKLLNYKVQDSFINFSKNDIFEIFQKDVERYGHVAQRPEEHDIEDFLNNNDFQTFLEDNYDSMFESDGDTSHQNNFLETLNKNTNLSGVLCYIFLTQVLYTYGGNLTLQDLNNTKNSCSIDTSGRELKTNERKRFNKFVQTCFDVDVDMNSDNEFALFLNNQKTKLENTLEEVENSVTFESASNLLKDIVVSEYISIEVSEVSVNE